MKAQTVEELVAWLERTTGPGDSPEKLRARFQAAFTLGTPRAVFAETERNFNTAMIAYVDKHGPLQS